MRVPSARITAMGALDRNGHMDQLALAEWARQPGGLSDEQKEFLFDMGDEMTEFQYSVGDGVGSLLGAGAMPQQATTSTTSCKIRSPTSQGPSICATLATSTATPGSSSPRSR